MLQIGETAIKEGFAVYTAFARGTHPVECEAIRIGNQNSVHYHGLVTRLFGRHGFSSKKSTRAFLREIDKIDPDLIHLHNLHGYYLNIELLFNYIKEKSIPVVWTLHDCWAFTGHCAYFDYVGCDKWVVGCNNCPQIHTYPRSLLTDYSKKAYERKKKAFTGVNNLTIVTPSRWLKDLVSRSFLKAYNTRVIYNGVDTDTFIPTSVKKSEFGIDDGKFVVLGIAAKFEPRKGLKYFIELSRRIQDDSIIFLVGLNKKQLRQLPRNVIGIRRTESVKDLARIYSMSDVFLNPTLEDNFPTTNLEALACGTPVITFRTGGSPESIDSKTGVVVEKGNTDKLTEAVSFIKSKGKQVFSDNCRERAVSLFRAEDRFRDYLQIYDELLSDNTIPSQRWETVF